MNELDEVFGAVAAYFAILSEPTRLKIMHSICDHERSVGEIVDSVSGTQTNVSRHLGLMYRAGVVARRKQGNIVFYRIADSEMVEVCRAVCNRIAAKIDDHQPLKRSLLKLLPAAKRKAA